MAWTLGQLQVIRWVISLIEYRIWIGCLAIGSDVVVSTNWIQVGLERTQRNSTGNLIGLIELWLRSRRPRIRTGPACCRCPPFAPRWRVSETIRLRSPVGVSLVAQGFCCLPAFHGAQKRRNSDVAAPE